MNIVRTARRDPWRALAVEDYLQDRGGEEPVLFLYRNDPVIVVGKNQNPWAEADVAAAAEMGVPFARRSSGGGAVVHDPGNLNYAFIVPRTGFEPARQFGIVLRALARFGIHARVEGRTALFADGRKISGNAFCLRGRTALHHGTLLVSADLDRIRRLLGRPSIADRGHAVPSRPAEVVNLMDLRPGLDADALEAALVEHAVATWGGPVARFDDEAIERWDWAEGWRRHASWEWQFGATPPFQTFIDLPSHAGRLRISVREGRMFEVALAGDGAMLPGLHAALHGRRFDPVLLAAVVQALDVESAGGAASGEASRS